MTCGGAEPVAARARSMARTLDRRPPASAPPARGIQFVRVPPFGSSAVPAAVSTATSWVPIGFMFMLTDESLPSSPAMITPFRRRTALLWPPWM